MARLSHDARVLVIDDGRLKTATAVATALVPGLDVDAETRAMREGIARTLADEAERQGVTTETMQAVTGVAARRWADLLRGRGLSLEWLGVLAALLGYRVTIRLEPRDPRAVPDLVAVASKVAADPRDGIVGRLRAQAFRPLMARAHAKR